MTAPTPPGASSKGRARSDWRAPAVRRRSVDDTTGTVDVTVDLSDQDGLQGTARLTMTPDRQLVLEWTGAPGSSPLQGFQAWERVN